MSGMGILLATTQRPCLAAISAFLSVFFALAACRQIAVEVLLQFVIQRDSEVLPAFAHDFGGYLLIQAVELGIVPRFFRFSEAVIRGLIRGKDARVPEKLLAVASESNNRRGIAFESDQRVPLD